MNHKHCSLGLVLTLSLSLLAGVPWASAQNDGGDQFLDGIGETALLARYLLDGNGEDRSRNSQHATLHGAVTYVEDRQFGKVLSLSGESEGYVQVPGAALAGVDALSVAGWVFLRSEVPWQRFFDFGPNTSSNFFCTPVGAAEGEGYRVRMTTNGWSEEVGPATARVATNRWVHLAAVLNPARHTVSSYLDGVRVGQATNVNLNLEQVLNQENAAANRLYLGKSRYDSDPNLNAKLHDVRLYSIVLTDQQVATIYTNALSGGKTGTLDKAASDKGESAGTGKTIFLPPNLELLGVPDIQVETSIGIMPRLPRLVTGVFRDGKPGPAIRVIWPAPKNNQQVLTGGTYSVTGRIPGLKIAPKAMVTVKAAPQAAPLPALTLQAFPLGSVVLNQDENHQNTPFIKNRDKFLVGLAKSDPDRFLYMFRNAFGQKQPEKAQPLGGWDSQTTRLRGHASGHYLSAIAQAYASTAYDQSLQANFLQKMNYLIDTLYDLAQKSGRPAKSGGAFNANPLTIPPAAGKTNYNSDLSEQGIRSDYWNWGTGFISAYPPDQFILLEKGATYGGGNRQIWAPYYTLHKILAGLLDCYEVGGNQKALQIAEGMGLWVHQRLSAVPPATRISMWNRYIAGEYGGMNEVMARLYRLTDDKRFLECARLFDNTDFFYGDANHTHGLAKNVDTLRGKHANQHIPQITGALELYRDTQNLTYYQIADNFWNICTENYQYSIGGVAGARNPNNAECFPIEPSSLFANGFSPGGQNETCATYNLLKLSRQLFMFAPDAKYMDYYEQALYNDILASVDQDNPGNTYHIPLNPAARKQFGNEDMDGFTCCNGTALESSTKLQDSIYFKSADNQSLYVNLYVPSTLTWKERKVVVTQRTSFPGADTTQLTITGGGQFALKVRVPQWATRGFFVKINGQEQTVNAKPGSYLTLQRNWRDQDTIELRMPFRFYLDRVMDQPNIASLFYGPVLLAAEEAGPRDTWRPVTFDADDIGKSISGDPHTLHFKLGDITFKPFYEMYGRYSVYLNVTLK